MESEILFWMTKGESRKPVIRAEVEAELLADGWAREEKATRGRAVKKEEE